jgi:NAD-dependent deacetylase
MTEKRHIVVLSGAGISAESGLQTFRGQGGLWEGHRVEEVASPHAWERDQEMVLRFYNMRRQQLRKVEPNPGHLAIAKLEQGYEVTVITQNVDNLHEQAGSTHVVHLHGELMKARSTVDESLIYDLEDRDIETGDLCDKGSQLRPHIVWFGESVPEFPKAELITQTADILIVVGTSLAVYPAAHLAYCARPKTRKYLIDPEIPESLEVDDYILIREKAGLVLPELANQLLERC